MAQMLVELSGSPIPPATVDKVAQLAQEADPKITPMKVKVISEMVESLSKEVPPGGVELVSSMVEKMGPILSHRETQMISRMAARSGIELTMSDIHILSDIANAVGNDLTTNDIEIISVLTKKAGDENADLIAKQNGESDNDSKLSMTVRLKKPTEKPLGEPDDDDSDDTDDVSNSDFGMKENSNKQRKQPVKFENFSPNENNQPTTTPSPSQATGSSNIRIRRPPASTTTRTTTSATRTSTVPSTDAEEDILKTSDARRRRPVPLRLAPVRPSNNNQDDPDITTPPTSTTTTSTTTTTTTSTTTPLLTTSRQRSTGKPQRFNSPSDAATMLNNALGNPVGNSFMQFFMGNKELNNFKFDDDKPAITTTNVTPPNDENFSANFNESPTEPNNFIKLSVDGQNSDNSLIQPFEKLVTASEEQSSSTVSFDSELLSSTQSPLRDVETLNFNTDNTGVSKDFNKNQELKNSEFPDFSTMLNGEPSPTNNPQSSQDLSRFRTTNNFQQENTASSSRANSPSANPQSALMNFLLKTNLKEQGTPLPTSFDPFVRETTTLDRTPSGNFMQILMGHQRLNGVDEKSSQLLKKLEKKKIPLDQTGDNFMAFSIGDQVQ